MEVPEDQELLRQEGTIPLEIRAVGLPLPAVKLTGPNGETVPLSLELETSDNLVIGSLQYHNYHNYIISSLS